MLALCTIDLGTKLYSIIDRTLQSCKRKATHTTRAWKLSRWLKWEKAALVYLSGNNACIHPEFLCSLFCKLCMAPSYTQVQTFSVMKGWVRAWLMVIRLAGSSMRHFSRKSLSCCTLRRWASSSFCPPIRDCSRSRDGVMVDIVVIFSYRMIESWSTRNWYTSSCNTLI